MTAQEAREKAKKNINTDFELKVAEVMKKIDKAAGRGKMSIKITNSDVRVISELKRLGYEIEGGSFWDNAINGRVFYNEIKW